MGFRYRKSISLARGVKINLTGRGISSVSIGKRGATLNMGSRGVTETVGIPGSGLSYSNRSSSGPALLIGVLVAVVAGLFVHAAKGNRPSQAALAALVVIFAIFWASNQGNRTRTIQMQKAEIAAPNAVTTGIGELTSQTQSPASASADLVAPQLERFSERVDPKVPPSSVVQSPLPKVDNEGSSLTFSAEDAAITTARANVRAAPRSDGKIIKQLGAHTSLFVVSASGDWVNVRDSKAGIPLGWVHKSLLKKA